MFDAPPEPLVRTTLSIDDDVLAAAKGLAARQGKPIGEVISALARQGLLPQARNRKLRNGIPLLATRAGGAPVTPEVVNRLRDELP